MEARSGPETGKCFFSYPCYQWGITVNIHHNCNVFLVPGQMFFSGARGNEILAMARTPNYTTNSRSLILMRVTLFGTFLCRFSQTLIPPAALYIIGSQSTPSFRSPQPSQHPSAPSTNLCNQSQKLGQFLVILCHSGKIYEDRKIFVAHKP